jgi:hypothetical protein
VDIGHPVAPGPCPLYDDERLGRLGLTDQETGLEPRHPEVGRGPVVGPTWSGPWARPAPVLPARAGNDAGGRQRCSSQVRGSRADLDV